MGTREEKETEAARLRRRTSRAEAETAKRVRREHRRVVRHNLRVGRWDDVVEPAKIEIELLLDTALKRRLVWRSARDRRSLEAHVPYRLTTFQ